MLYKITHGSFRTKEGFVTESIELDEKEAKTLDPSGECLMPMTQWKAHLEAEAASKKILSAAGVKPTKGEKS